MHTWNGQENKFELRVLVFSLKKSWNWKLFILIWNCLMSVCYMLDPEYLRTDTGSVLPQDLCVCVVVGCDDPRLMQEGCKYKVSHGYIWSKKGRRRKDVYL